MYEHQTDWYTYLFLLRYVYNVQQQRSIKVSLFSLALTGTLPGSLPIVPKRLPLAANDDSEIALYARFKLIRMTTSLRNKGDKNLKLGHKRYKHHHHYHVRLAPTFNEGERMYLDGTPLFRSAAENAATEGYRKLLSK